MSKQRTERSHLDNIDEWQKKQYTPWSYTTKGKLHPAIEAVGNPKRAAIIWFIQSFYALAMGVIATVGLGSVYTKISAPFMEAVEEWHVDIWLTNSWVFIPVFGSFALFAFIMGLRYWKKHKLQMKLAREKRTTDRGHKSRK